MGWIVDRVAGLSVQPTRAGLAIVAGAPAASIIVRVGLGTDRDLDWIPNTRLFSALVPAWLPPHKLHS